MNRRDAFDRILQSLHAAAFGDARWPAASGLIDEAIGVHGSLLVYGDGPMQNDILFARICARGERHRELERAYFRDYYPIDERLPRIRSLPDSRLTPVSSLSTEAERKTSAVYNELLPRMHGQNGLLVRLDGPDASRTTWSIGDPVDRDGWTSERVETIERLLPHLRHFLAVRHALLRSRALGASLVELLDNVRAGVIQLDRRGRLVAANNRARALLRRGDGLRDEDGRLRAALPREDATLPGADRAGPAVARRTRRGRFDAAHPPADPVAAGPACQPRARPQASSPAAAASARSCWRSIRRTAPASTRSGWARRSA